MAIEAEMSIEIERPVDQVFAFLDDVSQSPSWLSTCKALEKLTPGPNEVGTKLRYIYQDSARTIVMNGQIIQYVPNQQLAFEYGGDLVRARAEFKLTAAIRGTDLQYHISLEPQTFLARLASPLIRRQMEIDTTVALHRLRDLLEGP